MSSNEIYTIQKGNVFAVPAIHYKMEFAAQVHLAFQQIKPDCVAVELAETMHLQLLHAASRLPDISIVVTYNQNNEALYYLSEPCDAAFEAMRCGLENQIHTFCIDLDVDYYPDIKEALPDPYAIERIGLKEYYELYKKTVISKNLPKEQLDIDREMYMARRLKELSLSHDRILFVGGMSHIENVLKFIDLNSFPQTPHAKRTLVEVCTLTEESCRDVMAESGWISKQYEDLRKEFEEHKKNNLDASHVSFPPDRQKLIYHLYKAASVKYIQNSGLDFPGYNLRNVMKYVRNYSLIYNQLMPDLYQILIAAQGCVDHNYAYETWELATTYPYLKNVDDIPELDLTIEEVWGQSKQLRFHLKHPGRKGFDFRKKRKDISQYRFDPPGPFGICSYPPEDVVVERFGDFLKKKGTQIFTDEGARTVPFTTSIEDGIDTRESIRHWAEKKLYVKQKGKPPGGVGSVVVIFDEDSPEESDAFQEKFPWRITWIGEHDQESDMGFYATPLGTDIVGPGISRCQYGGFMMSYPPRRMLDIWNDRDYQECRTKAEVLLMAAIDYAVKPIVVYVASKPPRTVLKSFARRFGKKVVYIPIGQLSPITVKRIKTFHVLDGHDKRNIADDYIY
jgi:hypothetical protein